MRLYTRSFEGRREKLGMAHPSSQFSLYLLDRFKQKRAKWAEENNQSNLANLSQNITQNLSSVF